MIPTPTPAHAAETSPGPNPDETGEDAAAARAYKGIIGASAPDAAGSTAGDGVDGGVAEVRGEAEAAQPGRRRPRRAGEPPAEAASRAQPGRAGRRAPRAWPRAERPGSVASPEHHHLPGWVRRDYARHRPALADLLGLLQGEERAAFQRRIDEVTAAISAGKFSQAWQYPELVTEGRRLYERHRDANQAAQRAGRALETARRRAAERLRDAAGTLTPDHSARLHRQLRAATDAAAIAEVAAEADRSLNQARSSDARRRDREIERTRERIYRTLPRAVTAAEEPSETWQDVLRRFAEDQEAGEPSAR